MVPTDREERYREVEKRERLVQTFIIISGFFVTFTRGEFHLLILRFFLMYLIFAIFYYIFLSRTKNHLGINILAFLSSYNYSLLIVAFIEQLTAGFNSQLKVLVLFITLTAIFTFSLLSPETSEKIVDWFGDFSKRQMENHPILSKIVIITIILIPVVVSLYLYLTKL